MTDSGAGQSLALRGSALRITGIYAVVATLWIYFSDQVLFAVMPQAEDFTRWSVVKGLVFVAITSALLLWLMTRAFQAVERAWSALKQSERNLRGSRAQLSAMINSAMDAIVTVDQQDRVVLFNRAAERMFRCHSSDAIRQPVTRFLPAGLSPDGYDHHLSRGIRYNGEEFPIEAAVSDFRGDGGLMRTAILRDITRRLQRESELRELTDSLERKVAERTGELETALVQARAADKLKSAFLATMSHELRTPLNSIIGFTGILLQDLAGPLTDEQNRQLRMVQGSARHLLELINDVLDLSKIEAGELRIAPDRFAVDDSVERVCGIVSPMAEKKGLTLDVNREQAPAEMFSDRRRVEQILLNLLNNAIKFTDRGQVSLRIEGIADYQRSDTATPVDALRMTVTDTGIGIQEDDLAGLFRPFSQVDTGLTRSHDGTGLGLAICRRLADLLGGEIGATSQWQEGSTFTVTLPLDWRNAAPARQNKDEEKNKP